MKAFNCKNEGTASVSCDNSKGSRTDNWGASDRGVIEILANYSRSSNESDYGHYKIYSSKKTGKIIGPFKTADLNTISIQKYQKPFNQLKNTSTGYIRQGEVRSAFWATLKAMGTKAIALMHVRNAEVAYLDVSGFASETIYSHTAKGNVNLHHNRLHNNNTTGLNFNAGSFEGNRIHHNVVIGGDVGIEASQGTVEHNEIRGALLGFITGAGGGSNNLKFNHNKIYDAKRLAVSVTFAKEYMNDIKEMEFIGNTFKGANYHLAQFKNIGGITIKDNIVDGYGEGKGGTVFDFVSNVHGIVKNNTLRKAKMANTPEQDKPLITTGSNNVVIDFDGNRCIKWDKSGDRSCR